MGAAKDDRVDLGLLQRPRVFTDGRVHLLVRRRRLDQRHEPGACRLEDVRAGIERMDRIRIAAARDGDLGREDAYSTVPRRLHRGVSFGRKHADDRYRELLL
jgi:hypothetical protein